MQETKEKIKMNINFSNNNYIQNLNVLKSGVSKDENEKNFIFDDDAVIGIINNDSIT